MAKIKQTIFKCYEVKFYDFSPAQKKICIPTIEIEDTKINWAKIVTFLKPKINLNVTWNDHIEKVACKKTKVIDITHRIK